MNLSQRRIIQAIVGLLITFTIAATLTIRFGGSLTTTILGMEGTALTPAIGALVTLLIVTPIRNMTAKQNESIARVQDSVKDVDKKVNGQMDAMRAEVREANARAADVTAKNVALSEKLLRAAEDRAEAASRAEERLANMQQKLRDMEAGK